MTNNTSEISRGKFDNRMVIDSDDEFGELAIAFNDTIEHLQYKAEHDDITDVYNISTFYVQAERIIKNSQFDRKKYSIVRLDIDHFRMINDIYNWQVGNNVLLHIAECIRRHLADDSICGRISADIFVMCISYESIEQLEEILIAIKEDILTFEIIVNINPHFGVYLDAECDMPVYLMCDRAGMALSLLKGNLLATASYYANTINRKNMDIKFIENYMQNAIQDRSEEHTSELQ